MKQEQPPRVMHRRHEEEMAKGEPEPPREAGMTAERRMEIEGSIRLLTREAANDEERAANCRRLAADRMAEAMSVRHDSRETDYKANQSDSYSREANELTVHARALRNACDAMRAQLGEAPPPQPSAPSVDERKWNEKHCCRTCGVHRFAGCRCQPPGEDSQPTAVAADTDILDRWAGERPSISSYNHAVDVANANYRRAEDLAQRLAALEAERDDAQARWRSLATEMWEFVRERKLKAPTKGTENQRLIHAIGEALNKAEVAEAQAKAYGAKMVESINRAESIADERDRLRKERQALTDDITHWILVADGINHDTRCGRHFAGDPKAEPCLRCQLEDATVARVETAFCAGFFARPTFTQTGWTFDADGPNQRVNARDAWAAYQRQSQTEER